MLAKINSAAIIGVNGYLVSVEVDMAQGMPAFDVVGLPDAAVKESRERVRTAIRNSGYPFPVKRITVNLAPADIRKEGPSFDLPIAVGILVCIGVLPSDAVRVDIAVESLPSPDDSPSHCGARSPTSVDIDIATERIVSCNDGASLNVGSAIERVASCNERT